MTAPTPADGRPSLTDPIPTALAQARAWTEAAIGTDFSRDYDAYVRAQTACALAQVEALDAIRREVRGIGVGLNALRREIGADRD